MAVKALPEFVKLFKNTNFISCTFEFLVILSNLGEKDKSHILIRGNIKRSREDFEQVQKNIEKELWNEQKEIMEMQIENLKEKIGDFERMEEGYLLDRDKLYSLFEKGIIDESGAPIAHKEEADMK